MIDNKTIRKVIMLNKCLKGGSPTYENREATGAIANFTTNVVMPFISLDCEILPIQEGTGTPSPSNPRPISGTSTLDIYHSGADTSNPTTYPITLGRTVYGGSAEVDEGAGEETLGFVTLDGTEGTWGSSSSYDFRVQIPTMKYGDSLDGLAEWLATWKTSSETKPSVRFGANTTYLYFYNIIGNVSGVTDLASWKIYLANHPLKLAYPLATPTEYTFTGQPINSFEGVNNVWADSGNTKVTYKYKTGEGGSSTKKYLPIFYDFYGKEKYKCLLE